MAIRREVLLFKNENKRREDLSKINFPNLHFLSFSRTFLRSSSGTRLWPFGQSGSGFLFSSSFFCSAHFSLRFTKLQS